MTRNIVVTGSNGFLGRHFVNALAKNSFVRAIDISHDIGAFDALDFFRTSEKADLLVHCAAVIGGRQGIENNALVVGAANLQLDAAMFMWAARTKSRVLYISSSAAYPVEYQTDAHKLHENHINLRRPLLPDATYGWTKLTGEYLADNADFPIHVVRPFSGYGVDQSLDYPFPSIIKRARDGENPIEIWSDATRDFIHVSDVVAGALAVVEWDVREPVNLCTGVGTSFSQLAKMAAPKAKVKILEDKPKGVNYRVGDPTRMLEIYKPKVELEQYVRSIING